MRLLCKIADINPTMGYVVTTAQQQQVLLTKVQDQVYAYENRCPHANARLNMNGERVIALDGYHIMCTVHGAQFHPRTGHCTLGPCKGQHLSPLEIFTDSDSVWLLTDPE